MMHFNLFGYGDLILISSHVFYFVNILCLHMCVCMLITTKPWKMIISTCLSKTLHACFNSSLSRSTQNLMFQNFHLLHLICRLMFRIGRLIKSIFRIFKIWFSMCRHMCQVCRFMTYLVKKFISHNFILIFVW